MNYHVNAERGTLESRHREGAALFLFMTRLRRRRLPRVRNLDRMIGFHGFTSEQIQIGADEAVQNISSAFDLQRIDRPGASDLAGDCGLVFGGIDRGPLVEGNFQIGLLRHAAGEADRTAAG